MRHLKQVFHYHLEVCRNEINKELQIETASSPSRCTRPNVGRAVMSSTWKCFQSNENEFYLSMNVRELYNLR